ncbi:MAG: hypothetical protein F6K45_26210, partial [Kamptonema sp. SIO1D9]|nr:hypothetical protein [Kamptonema sp. SIO1D9]
DDLWEKINAGLTAADLALLAKVNATTTNTNAVVKSNATILNSTIDEVLLTKQAANRAKDNARIAKDNSVLLRNIQATHTSKLDKLLQGIDTALLLDIKNKVYENGVKLGVQVAGGISGTIGRLYDTLKLDRWLNLITAFTSMHNAIMLSRDIGETFFSVIDNVLNIFGFSWKDAEGNQVGMGEVASQWTKNLAIQVFGQEFVTQAAINLAKWNRIYQAASNVASTVRSIADSTRSIMELTAQQVAKFYNASIEDGLLMGDRDLFPENVTARTAFQQKMDNMIEGLESVEESVSALAGITGEVVSIQENLNELKKQREEYGKSIEGALTDQKTKEDEIDVKVEALPTLQKEDIKSDE